jgi:hypothetical protein
MLLKKILTGSAFGFSLATHGVMLEPERYFATGYYAELLKKRL